MKALKVMATINEQGQLTLDQPLTSNKNSRVEVIVLIPEDGTTEDSSQVIRVEVSLTFNRNLRTLAKKYRSVRKDIQPVIEQLQRGEQPGNQIPGVGI